jgi:hypothetical protein
LHLAQHLVERLAAVRVVAQSDRQGKLGKADRRRLALVRCRGGIGRGRFIRSSFPQNSNFFLFFLIATMQRESENWASERAKAGRFLCSLFV